MLKTLGGARAAGIDVITVSFPNPHPSSFAVPPEHSEGHPQVYVGFICFHCYIYRNNDNLHIALTRYVIV